VYHQVESLGPKQSHESIAVTNVHFVVRETSGRLLKALQIPAGVALIPQEQFLHIIIDAVHLVAARVIELYRLGID